MNQDKKSLILVATVILLASLTRLIPHYPNFTAIGAVALLGGAMVKDRVLSFVIPLAALFVSDVVLMNTLYADYNEGFSFFYSGMGLVYLGFVINVFIGKAMLKNQNTGSMIKASVLGAVAFFLISNFGSWLGNPTYPQNMGGLMTSYAMGLPFFGSQIAGNLFYGVLMLGAIRAVSLREVKA